VGDEPGTLRSSIKFVVSFDFVNKIFTKNKLES
jgi:hypothetical protein